ncbi:TNF receptor-associated factor 6-B [Ixodes scapularis]|uniref:TNF receptor-associated factor 6-B n=1 Tax=Ixodes scapularis TaxID=6945 RepID=UPI001C380ABD|nr:TNF receptor-associated factor 6-B [Ixodes scapularis]
MEASKVQQTANQTHMSQCPKIKRECSDCGVNVLNENLQHHLDTECQKRVVLCGACNSMMRYDECGEHREQCEKKKLACEYCKLELKGDNEKNEHLEICEDASIECAFKEFGCSEKAPRKEMQEHKKDPQNALLNQVMFKAIDTISELQQKIKDMERRNMSQQEEAKTEKAKLIKKIQELENRQMSKQEEARNENAKLVKRIQELENRQLEADQYRIDLEDDVKVHRTVLQNLEDKVGRISREAVTRRRVDTLNERVETYLGPLERLLNGLRDVDKE